MNQTMTGSLRAPMRIRITETTTPSADLANNSYFSNSCLPMENTPGMLPFRFPRTQKLHGQPICVFG